MQKQSALYRIMTYNDRILAFLVVMTVRPGRDASLIRRSLRVSLWVSGWCLGRFLSSMQKPAELAMGMMGRQVWLFLYVVQEIGQCRKLMRVRGGGTNRNRTVTPTGLVKANKNSLDWSNHRQFALTSREPEPGRCSFDGRDTCKSGCYTNVQYEQSETVCTNHASRYMCGFGLFHL